MISAVLLSLSLCGLLMMVYGFVSDSPISEDWETAALALFAGPAVIFVYFGNRLQDYKKLNPKQEEELAAMARRHPEISAYCKLVAGQGRKPVHVEFEACRELDEDKGHKSAQTPEVGK